CIRLRLGRAGRSPCQLGRDPHWRPSALGKRLVELAIVLGLRGSAVGRARTAVDVIESGIEYPPSEAGRLPARQKEGIGRMCHEGRITPPPASIRRRTTAAPAPRPAGRPPSWPPPTAPASRTAR